MLSGGVAGFYRDDQKTLYVVSRSGEVGPNEKVTFAHEFDHALQDQHFTIFRTRRASPTGATGCSPDRPSTKVTPRC